MGVPRLFYWILKNFPDAVKHFQQNEFSMHVNFLHLDANGILHNAAQKIFNYGDEKRKIDPNENLSDKAKRRKVFALFFKNLVSVTQTIIPDDTLYIAIDGPAPLSKQNQQRERRFVSAKDRLKEEEKSGKSRFDSNNITPGTLFMLELTRYMNYAIRKEMNSYGLWRNIKVYFSPPTVPGEGEHKIMDYIRTIPPEKLEKTSHCLFGPDGDLIMLTLAAHIPNISLFREDQYEKGYYHLLDMGLVRKNLGKIIPRQKNANYNDISDDFILTGFFVGNDFLPKIQMFHLLEEGLNFMISSYRYISEGRTNFLVEHGNINFSAFQAFVEDISLSEKKFLIDQVTTKNPKKMPPGPKFVNKTLLSCITEKVDPSSTKSEYSIDMEKYRQKYYEKCGIPGKIGEPEFGKALNKICRDYIKSFVWIFVYYTKGLPSWRWAYEYHYAPLMVDLNNYIQALDDEDFEKIIKFDLEEPSVPFEQLLSVLPPPSANLLPVQYRKLMLDPRSPLVKLGYYPEEFKIDYEGKFKDFQGIALLPFVNYDVIHKNYLRMTKCCVKNPKKYVRNSKGKVSIFTYDKKYRSEYKSDMGNITNLHVRKTVIIE